MKAYIGNSLLTLRRFIRRALLSTGILCLLVVSAGCMDSPSARVPISFEELCGFPQEQFASMDETALVQWVRDHYDVAPSKSSQRVESGIVVELYKWAKDGMRERAWLHDDQLAWILLEGERGVSFGQVVDALGPPETVRRDVTRQENTVYTIWLEYPTKGFFVGVDELRYGYVDQVSLSGSMQVNVVVCYTEGSLETVLENVFLVAPANMPYQMSKRMPWPGFGASIPLDPTP